MSVYGVISACRAPASTLGAPSSPAPPPHRSEAPRRRMRWASCSALSIPAAQHAFSGGCDHSGGSLRGTGMAIAEVTQLPGAPQCAWASSAAMTLPYTPAVSRQPHVGRRPRGGRLARTNPHFERDGGQARTVIQIADRTVAPALANPGRAAHRGGIQFNRRPVATGIDKCAPPPLLQSWKPSGRFNSSASRPSWCVSRLTMTRSPARKHCQPHPDISRVGRVDDAPRTDVDPHGEPHSRQRHRDAPLRLAQAGPVRAARPVPAWRSRSTPTSAGTCARPSSGCRRSPALRSPGPRSLPVPMTSSDTPPSATR